MKKDNKLLHIAIIIALTVAAYINSFDNSFHLDDRYAILEDELIRNLTNLPEILKNIFARPILRATFALNYHIGGTEVFGYHITNLFLHIVAALLVYVIARSLLTYSREKDTLRYMPLIAALIFALHPVQTGSVTYIASRSSVLMAIFFMISIIIFIRAHGRSGDSADLPKNTDEEPVKTRYILYIVAAFLLAVGVKQTALILPLTVLVVLYALHGLNLSMIKTHQRTLLTLFGVFALFLLTRYLSAPGVLPSDSRIEEGVLSAYPYLLTELNVIALHYSKWILLPFGGPHIDPDIVAEFSIFDISTLTSIALIAVALYAAVRLRKMHPIASLGILWFFITLAPASSLIPLGDVAAERRLYLPLTGVALTSAYVLALISKRIGGRRITAAYSIIFIGFIYLTFASNNIWQNEMTLWDHGVKKSPDKVRALNNRAWGHYLEGDLTGAKKLYANLITRFPEYPYAYHNLGGIYLEEGSLNAAIREYQTAVRLRPELAHFRESLGAAYDRAGLFKLGVVEFEKAIELGGESPKRLNQLASTLAKSNDCKRSIIISERSIGLDPTNAMARYLSGYCYEMTGNVGLAVEGYRAALLLNPAWSLPKERLRGLKK